MLWSLLLSWPMSLSAQREADTAITVKADTIRVADPTAPRDVGTLFFGGMAGMVTGAFGGGLIGTAIDPDTGLDDAEGAVYVGLIGTTILTPTAVHLANGSRGNLGRSVLVSTLLGGALLGLGVAAESGVIILAIPFVQLFTAITIERNTTKPSR
jgi:hypothetical protein